jgi:hypothetical protein
VGAGSSGFLVELSESVADTSEFLVDEAIVELAFRDF